MAKDLIKSGVRAAIQEKYKRKKDLFCFSKEDFDKEMEENGWNDDNLPVDCAFISIGEPDTKRHWFSRNHDNVLNIDFFDIDMMDLVPHIVNGIDADSGFEIKMTYNKVEATSIGVDGKKVVYECFNGQLANEVVEFILRNLGKHFYIHCAGGFSRSQAIVVFMLTYFTKWYDWDSINKANPPRIPNQWVAMCLSNALTGNVDLTKQKKNGWM